MPFQKADISATKGRLKSGVFSLLPPQKCFIRTDTRYRSGEMVLCLIPIILLIKDRLTEDLSLVAHAGCQGTLLTP